MFGTRSQGKVYNFVHTDEIWKDHVKRELQSQKKWTEQFGYLFEEYQKLQENLLNIGSDLEEDLQANNLVKLNKCEAAAEIPSLDATQAATDDAGGAVLKISDRIASLQDNARGKNDILKMLTWPREGVL